MVGDTKFCEIHYDYEPIENFNCPILPTICDDGIRHIDETTAIEWCECKHYDQ
jgi:hypothetical protein